MRIRSGRPSDAPQLLALIKGLAAYERLSDQVVAEEAGLLRNLFGERAVAETLIAEDQRQVVGFALFFPTFSTFLARPGIYLEDLFVLPDRRGQGIGRALLTEVARIADRRGCGRLEWSVLDWNQDAIGFYRRLGAAPLADWTVYRISGDELAQLARTKTDGGPPYHEADDGER